jgi:hypothetical protein
VEICPNCGRTISSVKQWHYCARVELHTLFQNKKPLVNHLFDQLLSHLIDWPDMAYSATKNCIVFVHKKTFLVVKPLKTALDIKFHLPYFSEEFPIYKTAQRGSKFESSIRLHDFNDLDQEVIRLIRFSYDMS